MTFEEFMRSHLEAYRDRGSEFMALLVEDLLEKGMNSYEQVLEYEALERSKVIPALEVGNVVAYSGHWAVADMLKYMLEDWRKRDEQN